MFSRNATGDYRKRRALIGLPTSDYCAIITSFVMTARFVDVSEYYASLLTFFLLFPTNHLLYFY